jgi:hypothetical protein
MNPRHAVALALVGWYLMVPPPRHNVRFPARRLRPLRRNPHKVRAGRARAMQLATGVDDSLLESVQTRSSAGDVR